MDSRYTFLNYSDQPFDGKMGGVPYHFEAGETKEFDPDKHGMLVVMAKHLADREILKRIKGVGRDPNNQETWAKSLDEHGKPFTITSELRKEYIRRAVGDLVDTPVPIPEEQVPEVGATQKMSSDVNQLQSEVKDLKETIASLTGQIGKLVSGNGHVPSAPPREPVLQPEAPSEGGSLARSALEELAKDVGVDVLPTMTKRDILEAIHTKHAVA